MQQHDGRVAAGWGGPPGRAPLETFMSRRPARSGSLTLIATCLGLVSAVLLTALARPYAQAPAARTDNLILITLDGARTEEIFGGLDAAILASTLAKGAALEDHPLYKRYNAATAEERRILLMPFFWRELMTKHGSIAGNRQLQSAVTLTNTHRFSFPGYSEILLGEAHDDVIKSNDRVQNPYTTLLEELKAHLRLPASRVAAFGSWEVFNEIVEHTPGALTVNAGFESFDTADNAARQLSRLQFETRTPWNSVRHDVYTFRLALAHMAAAKPRVLYLALGETDDWAHDGRYDRVLESLARTDEYLRELWSWLQAQSAYRGRTHILITTDHGRGRTAGDWRNHGAKVDGAQDVWMAFISPAMARRGEWRDHPPLHTSQAAATMAAWMGLDWNALRPSAGRPVR
jgi:hypothetical protein